MKLKVYADRMSQPSRAVIIFCKVNGIDFEEIEVSLTKRQRFSPEFKEINPMKKVLAIVDEYSSCLRVMQFLSILLVHFLEYQIIVCRRRKLDNINNEPCLFGILRLTRPVNELRNSGSFYDQIWMKNLNLLPILRYPNDLFKRAQIQSVLDWHHSNLRLGAAKFVLITALARLLGLPVNPQAAAEAEKILSQSLSKVESFWLKGSERFLVGSNQPSIADLSLVCEIMQLEVFGRDRSN